MTRRTPCRARRFTAACAAVTVSAGAFTGIAATSATAAPASVTPATSSADSTTLGNPASRPLETRVLLKNNTKEAVYTSSYRGMGVWSDWTVLWPGHSRSFRDSYRWSDDVEFRISTEQSKSNSIDVDAENPAYSTPWMSVDWNSEYFNVGGTYTWEVKDGGEIFGTRHHDSDDAKQFELVINKVW
jgi:hypothetical protein